ncbi:MAG: flagellar biosynthesis protein FliQ [Oscillospiraceae bacterium]|jgi:flagellar biosynthetic protein FliQ|nr:flagellar biosynthesis protein FliQ [Oscillospiraceae bacterium]
MIETSEVITIISEGVWTVITASAPILIVGIVVGLIVSVFQATTSINEQTLAFVPKIIAILLSLIVFGSFIINQITDYIRTLYESINVVIR